MKMKNKLGLSFALLTAMGASSFGDVWFTHDLNVLALPPGPANGVFAQADVNDMFFSSAYIRTAPGPNLGNLLVLDNPGILGLLPGDNIDAIHHEIRALGTSQDEFPAFVFSVNAGDTGLAGTSVRAQSPDNAADLYESNGFGYNVLDTNENQIGLAPGVRVDVDGFFLTPTISVDPGGWIYFSLTPGSPSLAVLGASASDILSVQIGGTPGVCIPGNEIGLNREKDDLDGLIMFHGIDGDSDGDFNDDSDTYPYIVFSVSPNSTGLPSTGVRRQSIIDAPVGGDIFSSIGFMQNVRIMDDGQYGLGLEDDDDVDGLDLPSMAVPADHPLGTPFTAGFSTPGAPGTPGGAPLPAPGGSGGVPGCTPLVAMQFGLCVKSLSSTGTCMLYVNVFISCRTPGNPATLTVGPIPVRCDNGDGLGVLAAVKALSDALKELEVPSGPDAGKPLFAPGAGGVGGFGSGSNGGAFGVLDVNGALTDCAVKGFGIVLGGCACYTQNFKVMAWEGELVEYEDPGTVEIGFQSDVDKGVYMLRFEETADPHYIETPSGSALGASTAIVEYFNELGYAASVHDDGDGLSISEDPLGQTIAEVSGAGFVVGGTEYLSLGFHALEFEVDCSCDLNGDGAVDIDDVLMFIEMYHDGDEYQERLDVDESGTVNFFDIYEIVNSIGSC